MWLQVYLKLTDWMIDFFFLCTVKKLKKKKNKNKMWLKLEIEMLAYDWLDSILFPSSQDFFFMLTMDLNLVKFSCDPIEASTQR